MTDSRQMLDALRQRSFRITPQREMIVRALVSGENGRHLTADEIHSKVQVHTSALNIATVYRTLDLLVEEGLVSRIDVGGGQIIYASMDHGTHIHLVCRHCKHIVDADASLLQDAGSAIYGQYGFQADLDHIALFGVCAHCQKGDS